MGAGVSGFTFGVRASMLLMGVKPELREVAKLALSKSKVCFTVVQGNRTLQDQFKLFGKGRTGAECERQGCPAFYAAPGEHKVTWTLRSDHIGGKAIDVAPVIDGKIFWDDNGKAGLWPQIAAAFKAAAAELEIDIEWGGEWHGTPDRPHFALKG